MVALYDYLANLVWFFPNACLAVFVCETCPDLIFKFA